MKCPEEFVFTDPAVQSNPLEYFASMRKHKPVYREPLTGVYFVTRADHVREAADQPDVFSNVIDPSVFRACSGGNVLKEKDPEIAKIFEENGWLMPFTLLFNDPPLHGYYRKLANEALSPKKVKLLEPFIQEQTDKLIAAFSKDGNVEFISEFAIKLPISVIAEFLGAGEQDWDTIRGWSEQTFSTLFGQTTREEYLVTVNAILEMQHFIAGKIAEQKINPKENLLRTLMTVHEELDLEPLTTEEILSIYHVLLVAAHDTTRQTLGNCLRVVAEFPDIANILRQQPGKIPEFISEVLRVYHPAGIAARFATRNTELGGVNIPKGSTVYLAWSSAGYDEDKIQCPEHFNMERSQRDSFGFGYGIHFCVGARLAKTILNIALQTILNEYKTIQLRMPVDKLQYVPVINHCSLVSLPLSLSRN